jgi:hypothetical protein
MCCLVKDMEETHFNSTRLPGSDRLDSSDIELVFSLSERFMAAVAAAADAQASGATSGARGAGARKSSVSSSASVEAVLVDLVSCEVLYFDNSVPSVFIEEEDASAPHGFRFVLSPLPEVTLRFALNEKARRLRVWLSRKMPLSSSHGGRRFKLAFLLGDELVYSRPFVVLAKKAKQGTPAKLKFQPEFVELVPEREARLAAMAGCPSACAAFGRDPSTPLPRVTPRQSQQCRSGNLGSSGSEGSLCSSDAAHPDDDEKTVVCGGGVADSDACDAHSAAGCACAGSGCGASSGSLASSGNGQACSGDADEWTDGEQRVRAPVGGTVVTKCRKRARVETNAHVHAAGLAAIATALDSDACVHTPLAPCSSGGGSVVGGVGLVAVDDDDVTCLPGTHFSSPPSMPHYFASSLSPSLPECSAAAATASYDDALWYPVVSCSGGGLRLPAMASPTASPNLGPVSSQIDALMASDTFESWMLAADM